MRRLVMQLKFITLEGNKDQRNIETAASEQEWKDTTPRGVHIQ
jgi:hypothetical protein